MIGGPTRKAITIAVVLGAFAFAPLLGGVRFLAVFPLAGAHFLSSRWSQCWSRGAECVGKGGRGVRRSRRWSKRRPSRQEPPPD